jgi:hypothetical protein
MKNAVYCIAGSEPAANGILQQLRNSGFGTHEISVMLKEDDTRNISVRENAVRGVEKGGLIGGILGGLAGLTALTIPAVGAFMVAGPIISALGGAAVGGAIGGLAGGTGAMNQLGIDDEAAACLEERIRSGGIFIAVHTDDRARLERAHQIFHAAGGEEICSLPDRAA